MRIDHWNRVSMSIRFKINLFDQQEKGEDSEDYDETSKQERTNLKSPFKSGHIILGAAQKNCSFSEASAAHSDDPAFANFKNKFNHFIQSNNSEFIGEDLHSILDSTTSVCLHSLKLKQLKIH
jgi:hypothetical protein